MSGSSGTCRECQGKFWPGLLGAGGICGTCEALLRLRLFVASGRCPGNIGDFIEDRVRECHRLLLEEAERWWTAQPLPETGAKGLQLAVKAPSPVGPPPASGGPREERAGGERERKREREVTPPPKRSERRSKAERKEDKDSSHRRHRRRKERTSRSPRQRVHEEEPRREAAPVHPKKHREEELPGSPLAEVKEEPSEDTSSADRGEAEVERPASFSPRRSSGHRQPRSPVHSPPRRKWEGPIPAGGRQSAGDRRSGRSRRGTKKPKKNKGKKKRENHQRWLRENRGYRKW